MADCISYAKTPYFSGLITDYLQEKPALHQFYHRFPNLQNLKLQADEKQKQYPMDHRKVLGNQLSEQYQGFSLSETTAKNLDLLKDENTLTVTTGHQLNLFTGPLYFFYKIVSTLNLCEQLQEKYPDYNFVPVYWMATEDHDFEEINFFRFQGEKLEWKRAAGGAVGELSTDGLDEVAKAFSEKLNQADAAKELQQVFSEAYVKHDNLADATRYLVNYFFGEHGLVIVDGNDKALKKLFSPYVQEELLEQSAYEHVNQSSAALADLHYKIQVNPREINLFYLKDGLRERIVKEEGVYGVHDTEIRFSEAELLTELQQHPERFSPNVIMRPLYQEVILPNICYIGGGGELAYWFQLKRYFEQQEIPFPVLLLRNSALLQTQKQHEKAQKLTADPSDLFKKQADLMGKRTKELSAIDIDFSKQKAHLQQQFKALYQLAEKTDASFVGAVAAQEQKQLNGLSHLEKRLLKAQKRKLSDQLERLQALQDELFPNQSLQERYANFSEFYQAYGSRFVSTLRSELNPLALQFSIITFSA